MILSLRKQTDCWLKHKSTSSEAEPAQKETPEPEKLMKTAPCDVNINNVNPQTGNCDVTIHYAAVLRVLSADVTKRQF